MVLNFLKNLPAQARQFHQNKLHDCPIWLLLAISSLFLASYLLGLTGMFLPLSTDTLLNVLSVFLAGFACLMLITLLIYAERVTAVRKQHAGIDILLHGHAIGRLTSQQVAKVDLHLIGDSRKWIADIRASLRLLIRIPTRMVGFTPIAFFWLIMVALLTDAVQLEELLTTHAVLELFGVTAFLSFVTVFLAEFIMFGSDLINHDRPRRIQILQAAGITGVNPDRVEIRAALDDPATAKIETQPS